MPISSLFARHDRGHFGARAAAAGLALLGVAVTGSAHAHGLISSPPSRNWMCGNVTRPDQAGTPQAAHPECAEAFAEDRNGGYQFMSVLTHAQGRSVVDPLPEHVCGFGSETWKGGATPWDRALDWPTTPMTAGRQRITWDISWGPHFDDTEEFRYWITKADFTFDPSRPLRWEDFEEAPFCVLQYRDDQPSANPDVVADKSKALFHTTCDVPERAGHHVIYGEWGRNKWTYERFHGCVDVAFGR